MLTISYETKAVYFYPISTIGLPSTTVDGLKVSETLSLDGKLLRKSNNSYISDLVNRHVYLLNGIEWHIALALSFIIHIYRSIIPKCSVLYIFAVNQVVRTFLML